MVAKRAVKKMTRLPTISRRTPSHLRRGRGRGRGREERKREEGEGERGRGGEGRRERKREEGRGRGGQGRRKKWRGEEKKRGRRGEREGKRGERRKKQLITSAHNHKHMCIATYTHDTLFAPHPPVGTDIGVIGYLVVVDSALTLENEPLLLSVGTDAGCSCDGLLEVGVDGRACH